MRRYSPSRRLVAIESEDMAIVDTDVSNVVVSDEAPVEDLGESVQGIQDTEKELDQVDVVSEALESIYEAFSIGVANGGFNKVSVHAINVAVECLSSSIGITAKPNYSLESFDDLDARVGAVGWLWRELPIALKQPIRSLSSLSVSP